MEIDRDEFERAEAAITPFVLAWGLPMNPEEIAEMAYSVLLHARSDRSLVEIDQAVKEQLAEYKQKMEAFDGEAYGKKD